jgi:hypothetical protein
MSYPFRRLSIGIPATLAVNQDGSRPVLAIEVACADRAPNARVGEIEIKCSRFATELCKCGPIASLRRNQSKISHNV